MHKIITAIAFELNDAVKLNRTNSNALQLDMFKQNPDTVYLSISYRMILRDATHYEDIRKALKSLATHPVEIPYIDKVTGKDMLRITGLLRANIPLKANYDSRIEIEMEKTVIEKFVRLEGNSIQGQDQYTKYLYEVTQNATSQYTPPLYKILASWRSAGIYKISLEALKAQLCIPEKSYKRYFDFKRKVLKPVQSDLQDKADLWFDCERKDFKRLKTGQIHLYFTLITPVLLEEEKSKRDNIINMLRNFGLNDLQVGALKSIIYNNDVAPQQILEKITLIDDKIYRNNSDKTKPKIENKSAYMLRSLVNSYKEENNKGIN